ncbi:TPA: hypothetical protein ACH3X3_006932 [Trebouxia sp. C0006]
MNASVEFITILPPHSPAPQLSIVQPQIDMRVSRQRQENIAPEVQTPSVLKDHIFKSHPLDMDSDSEASYTSSLDNHADHSTSPGKQEGQEPSASAQSTARKLNQQVSSQRADFIASHTPTSLNKAHKMAGSMQSLAREAAMAAANRAGNVSRSIEAAADIEMDQASSATLQVCPHDPCRQVSLASCEQLALV